MENLNLIDEGISIKLEELKKVTDKLTFTEVCQFKLQQQIEEIPWDSLVYPGIYQLEIKNDGKHSSFESWICDFKLGWEDEAYHKHFVPNLKKKRIEKHSELNEWIPIYIGKSKNIGSRLVGHIYQELHKTTFALKLLARKNLKENTFRLSTIPVDVKNYDTIVPIIESILRDRINPIIGKQ